jgi:rhodanese-related sulfurtransferase
MTEQSRTNRWLAVMAGALGALALAAGEPYPAGRGPAASHDVRFATAVDVARWIRNREPALRIVDVRDDSLFDAYHVPGAERLPLDELSSETWQQGENIVLYAEDDGEAIRAAAILRRRGIPHAKVLRGGLLSWVDEIAQPHLAPLPDAATPADQAARREQLELSRYFGGTPVVSPVALPATAPAPSSRSDAGAVARIIRRGC